MYYVHLVLTGAADVRGIRQDVWAVLSSKIVLDDSNVQKQCL